MFEIRMMTLQTIRNIGVEVFWVVTPCNAGDSAVLRHVGILPQHYTASQPRRPRLESSLPWKHQISQSV